MEIENLRIVKNGVLRLLPPGFRFHPTDEELVVQYLKKKAFSFPLPASVIPEIDICKFDPWDLPGNYGNLEGERYFFSRRESVKYGQRSKRASGSGYWKATGTDKKILSSKENELVGLKKTLVFYSGKPSNGCKTDWIMHEYRLLDSAIFTHSNDQIIHKKSFTTHPHPLSFDGRVEKKNWVLCRIFLKKRRTKEREDRKGRPIFHGFLRKSCELTDSNFAPSSSSSGSSGITEISINDHDDDNDSDHEETSSCNNLSESDLIRR